MWAWVITTSLTSREREAGLLERALEVAHRAAVVHARVDEHDPVAGLQRPRVAVRDAGQIERQPQPPDARAAPARRGRTSRVRVGLRPASGGHATVPAMAKKGRRNERSARRTVRVPRRARLGARAARRADARDARAVRGGRRAATSSRARTPGSASVEFLFERLAVRWEIAGTEPITRQKELLARFRFASADERRWIRETLREHLAEHFPDMEAP